MQHQLGTPCFVLPDSPHSANVINGRTTQIGIQALLFSMFGEDYALIVPNTYAVEVTSVHGASNGNECISATENLFGTSPVALSGGIQFKLEAQISITGLKSIRKRASGPSRCLLPHKPPAVEGMLQCPNFRRNRSVASKTWWDGGRDNNNERHCITSSEISLSIQTRQIIAPRIK